MCRTSVCVSFPRIDFCSVCVRGHPLYLPAATTTSCSRVLLRYLADRGRWCFGTSAFREICEHCHQQFAIQGEKGTRYLWFTTVPMGRNYGISETTHLARDRLGNQRYREESYSCTNQHQRWNLHPGGYESRTRR